MFLNIWIRDDCATILAVCTFFNRDANNFKIKPNLDSCLSGIDFGMNPNDCPGSCNMTYTADTFDKFNECECVCIDGYTGVNCTVIIFAM